MVEGLKGVIVLSVKIDTTGQVVTAYLEGDIDHHTAREMREKIAAEIEQWRPSLLILDFRDVTFMDSSGIGLVMGRYKSMQQVAGRVRVTNCSPCIYKVMKIAGLDRLAEISAHGAVAPIPAPQQKEEQQ